MVDEPWFVPKDTSLLSGLNKALSRYPDLCLPTTKQGCGCDLGSTFKSVSQLFPKDVFKPEAGPQRSSHPTSCLCPLPELSLLDTLRMLQSNVRLFLSNGSLATFSVPANKVSSHRSASSSDLADAYLLCRYFIPVRSQPLLKGISQILLIWI